MNEAELVAMVEGVELDAYPAAAAKMTDGGDGWLGSDRVRRTARLTVAAWAVAVNGDDSILTRIADPEAPYWLLHPPGKDWMVAPDPRVTEITIGNLDLDADPTALWVTWQFTGRRHWAAKPDRTEAELVFVGSASLTLTGSGAWRWRLASAAVSTLDDYLGWTFDRRVETAAEYRRRTGTSAGTGVLIPSDTYVLDADFFDHDVRWGASAQAEVSSDPAPTRLEAERLIWPAIWARVSRSYGENECYPSLNALRMRQLLAGVNEER